MSSRPTPPDSPATVAPAEVPARTIARLVDGVTLAGLNGLVLTPLIVGWLAPGAEFGALGLLVARTGRAGIVAGAVAAVTGLAYFAVAEARWGRTLGKAMVGLEVRDRDGGAPSAGSCLVRNAWVALGVVPTVVGDVLAAVAVVSLVVTITVDVDRRGWHDRLAGLRVVRHQPRTGQ